MSRSLTQEHTCLRDSMCSLQRVLRENSIPQHSIDMRLLLRGNISRKGRCSTQSTRSWRLNTSLQHTLYIRLTLR